MEKTKMPDLFVVMSSEELNESIEYAIENGAHEAVVYEGIQYDLSINELDVEEFITKTDVWFPWFTEYVELQCYDDTIGILLSPTVWNEYNIDLLYSKLEEEKIKYICKKNSFINKDEFIQFKKEERKFSLEKPINSPWTARDLEVVKTSLEEIENIKNATLFYNVNFIMIFHFCFAAKIPIPMKLPIAKFYYPNVLHLDTKNGYYNVYIGEDIKKEDVISLLEEKNIDFLVDEYKEEDMELLLYQSRNRTRLAEKRGNKI